jgi:proline dehydrogenase
VDQQRRLRDSGYRLRVLIAYGEYWYPWYVRRLAERPANLWFALRQLLPW